MVTYYTYEGTVLIPVTKMFIRQKRRHSDEPQPIPGRKRRDESTQQLPPIPEGVTVGEVGEPVTRTDIVNSAGDILGSCDSDNVCQCIDGYRPG